MNTLSVAGENYFSICNYTSKRILEDIKSITSAHKDFLDLPQKKQAEIINKGLYKSNRGSVCSFKQKINPEKVVYEDNCGNKWEDEFSGPFSWETVSQQNFHFGLDSNYQSDMESEDGDTSEEFDTSNGTETFGNGGYLKCQVNPENETKTFDPPELVLGGSNEAVMDELRRRLRGIPLDESNRPVSAGSLGQRRFSSPKENGVLSKGRKLLSSLSFRKNKPETYQNKNNSQHQIKMYGEAEDMKETLMAKSKLLKSTVSPPPPPKLPNDQTNLPVTPKRPKPPPPPRMSSMSPAKLPLKEYIEEIDDTEENICLLPETHNPKPIVKKMDTKERDKERGNIEEPSTIISYIDKKPNESMLYKGKLATAEPSQEDEENLILEIETKEETVVPRTGFDFLDNW